jgi:hypothetical protein
VYSPLLQTDHSPSDSRFRNLRLINRYDRTTNTDTQTRHDPTDDEHSPVNRSALKDRTDNPEKTAEHDGFLPAETIGEESDEHGTDEGASGHRGCNGTLLSRVGETEGLFVVVILGNG